MLLMQRTTAGLVICEVAAGHHVPDKGAMRHRLNLITKEENYV